MSILDDLIVEIDKHIASISANSGDDFILVGFEGAYFFTTLELYYLNALDIDRRYSKAEAVQLILYEDPNNCEYYSFSLQIASKVNNEYTIIKRVDSHMIAFRRNFRTIEDMVYAIRCGRVVNIPSNIFINVLPYKQ